MFLFAIFGCKKIHLKLPDKSHTLNDFLENKHGIQDGRQIEFRTEKNIMCSTCVFFYSILSCKLIYYIVMGIYDLRPLLEHSEPKMASKMAVSI